MSQKIVGQSSAALCISINPPIDIIILSYQQNTSTLLPLEEFHQVFATVMCAASCKTETSTEKKLNNFVISVQNRLNKSSA